MVTRTLLCVLLALPAWAQAAPPLFSVANGAVTVALPANVLQTPVVKKQLASGLTTTFILAVKPHGGAQIEIRYDLWDEVYLVRRIEFDGRREAQKIAPDQLEKWWRAPVRIGEAAPRVDLQLLVLPFSGQEERDAREWLSKSGGVAGGSGLVDALIGTTISARPLVSFRWSADLRNAR
jgi:hypothetical protein